MPEAEGPALPASDTLAFFEVVRFVHPDPEFAEISGREGFVNGKGVPADDEVAVYFYDLERVWCVPVSHCMSTGRIDEAEKASYEAGYAAYLKRHGLDGPQG
ncbi:hypothetical protein EMQ25_06585 [Arsenicitalea aurantiaca]|uniref:Uncharacterized protein n=1 Tax=Arsenicitalea aurantiaca TaxID=1783274 RepID=A0A433XFM0_9HYPH|nr:hypothetical protein [Arsenicitalea aurantiaca]RUT32804.1 hypothetical protein EMQ25_06585 [Arsenicitalea aurantiaca]